MENHTVFTRIASAVMMAWAVGLCGCDGSSKNADGGITTFDIEAAIDNPRTFDLAGIAREITFIPLDDSRKEGLLGEITGMTESRGKFYVQDNGREFLIKAFDRQGRFLSTLGRYGRGPDEFMGRTLFAVDYDRDIFYVAGQMGDMNHGVRYCGQRRRDNQHTAQRDRRNPPGGE